MAQRRMVLCSLVEVVEVVRAAGNRAIDAAAAGDGHLRQMAREQRG